MGKDAEEEVEEGDQKHGLLKCDGECSTQLFAIDVVVIVGFIKNMI